MAAEVVDLREGPDDGMVEDDAMIGAEFSDELFQSQRVRHKITKAHKRANKRKYLGERPQLHLGTFGEVTLTMAEVDRL